MDKKEKDAGWGYNKKGEPRWPAALATLFAVVLYIFLPERFTTGPIWVLPTLELLLLIPLLTFSWRRHALEKPWHRAFAILLIVIINLYTIFSLISLLYTLTHPHAGFPLHGDVILLSAGQIWITTVIVFGLWYWELDRGGPAERSKAKHRNPDFLFPQMANPDSAMNHWAPTFFDYLYVSFTNGTAFSPTDTLPLTRWAKTLMMIQSFASLITIVLLTARAVNILA